MGPLLIAGYGAGAFLAASVAMWWHLRSGRTVAAFMLAMGLFALWIGAVTVGAVPGRRLSMRVTAARLESMAAPLASTNDQLALVTWFRQATPEGGFGLGAAPWCGWAAGRPVQRRAGPDPQRLHVHRHRRRVRRAGGLGRSARLRAVAAPADPAPRARHARRAAFRGRRRTLGNDGQALLSWMAVGWVVLCLCQLAVTVAGNLAVLPLTGVTFPFVSFGMTSLIVNLAFLALCLNVDLPARGRRWDVSARTASLLDFAIAASLAVVPVMLAVLVAVGTLARPTRRAHRPTATSACAMSRPSRPSSRRSWRADAASALPTAAELLRGVPRCEREWGPSWRARHWLAAFGAARCGAVARRAGRVAAGRARRGAATLQHASEQARGRGGRLRRSALVRGRRQAPGPAHRNRGLRRAPLRAAVRRSRGRPGRSPARRRPHAGCAGVARHRSRRHGGALAPRPADGDHRSAT